MRLIKEIPNGDLLRIEGQNGIGKTLAVRLLELCTGIQPYATMPGPWRTLQANLGKVTIRVSGLKGGESLQFELDSNAWPTTPESPGDWLGVATRDDRRIEWLEVWRVLSVRRVGGDETVGGALAGQVEEDAGEIRRLLVRQQPQRQQWGRALQGLRSAIESATSIDLDSLRDQVESADLLRRNAVQDEEKHQEQLTRLSEASRLNALIQRVEVELPDLETQLGVLQEREQGLRQSISALDTDAADVLHQQRLAHQNMTAFLDLARKARLRRERRTRREIELQRISDACGVTVPVDLAEGEHVVAELQAALEENERLRLQVDRAGLTIEAISSLERSLLRAETSGLADDVIAELPRESVTAKQLGEGLVRRREQLQSRPSDEAIALSSKIHELQQQLAAARQLPDAVRLHQKAIDDLSETQRDLDELLSGFQGDAAGEYQRLDDRRSGLLDELAALVETKSSLESQIADISSEGSVDELLARIQTLWSSPARPESFKDAIIRAERALETSEDTVIAATYQRDRATRLLAEAESLVKTAAQRANSAEHREWLAKAAFEPAPTGDDIAALAGWLSRLHGALRRTLDLLAGSLSDLEALEAALAELAKRLRASMSVGNLDNAGESEVRFMRVIRRHYEQRFADELATPELRSALFDGGDHITVDLLDMTTSWRSADGLSATRPLEAFSSGERAFAYTRVQVDRMVSQTAENRVLVLDEFGAFVARDRLGQLRRYLRHRVVGKFADQVLLILPLPSNVDAAELDQRGGYVVAAE